MKDECEENLALVVGATIGVLATLVVVFLINMYLIHKEVVCREGKLYEVTYEGNIIIYDPNYSECEETKLERK